MTPDKPQTGTLPRLPRLPNGRRRGKLPRWWGGAVSSGAPARKG